MYLPTGESERVEKTGTLGHTGHLTMLPSFQFCHIHNTHYNLHSSFRLSVIVFKRETSIYMHVFQVSGGKAKQHGKLKSLLSIVGLILRTPFGFSLLSLSPLHPVPFPTYTRSQQRTTLKATFTVPFLITF